MMARKLPLVASIVAVLAAGLFQGLWFHRWTAPRELRDAADRLDQVPLAFGDWVGRDEEFDRRQLVQARINGYLYRRYTKPDGTSATILLVCGRTGPISVHTPDVCYAGAGYEVKGTPAKFSEPDGSGGRAAEFWTCDFRKQNSPVPQHLRIYWSWNSTGAWAAPDNPRPFFAGTLSLYKLYVISSSVAQSERVGYDPAAALAKDLLPVLDRALAPDRRVPAPAHS